MLLSQIQRADVFELLSADVRCQQQICKLLQQSFATQALLFELTQTARPVQRQQSALSGRQLAPHYQGFQLHLENPAWWCLSESGASLESMLFLAFHTAQQHWHCQLAKR